MQPISNGTKVWVRILAGPSTPEALAPGIVTDARVGTRTVPRSAAKGGELEVPNSVVVISYRTPPTRDPFYTERPEQVIGLFPRDEHLPVIDGPADADLRTQVIPALRREVQAGIARLAPPPAETMFAAAAAEYGEAPALALG